MASFLTCICSLKTSLTTIRANDLRFLYDVSDLSLHFGCCIFLSLLFGWWCFGNCWIIEYVVWVRLVMHAGVGVFADLDFIIVDCSWSNGSVMLGWLD